MNTLYSLYFYLLEYPTVKEWWVMIFFFFKIVYIDAEMSWALELCFQMRIWILNELTLPETT